MATDATATSWHRVVPTALGELTLVRGADALLGLYFPSQWYRPDPVTFGPRHDDGFDEAAGQLGEYLDGRRKVFDLALEPRGLVRHVPYGDTVAYGDPAGRLGREVTAQQVGAAVGRNPLCIFVSCHRVVGAAGRLTGYAGGLARKRHLLDLEETGLPPLLLPEAGTGRATAAR